MNWSTFLLEIFFPSYCRGCKSHVPPAEALCVSCASSISLNAWLFCTVCGARIPGITKVCHPKIPYILGAATSYDDERIRNLILALKFYRIKNASHPLAGFLISYAQKLSLPRENSVVIPIPLSRARERERGFNQSALIARLFASHFSLPIEENVLLRTRNTKPQSEMKGREARSENMRDSFSLSAHHSISGKTIFLIDDVTTSGATFYEAAQALKAAHARRVIALAVARA